QSCAADLVQQLPGPRGAQSFSSDTAALEVHHAAPLSGVGGGARPGTTSLTSGDEQLQGREGTPQIFESKVDDMLRRITSNSTADHVGRNSRSSSTCRTRFGALNLQKNATSETPNRSTLS
ncbi:unnamed protein product, partial [Amoebophrya sp. A120]